MTILTMKLYGFTPEGYVLDRKLEKDNKYNG